MTKTFSTIDSLLYIVVYLKATQLDPIDYEGEQTSHIFTNKRENVTEPSICCRTKMAIRVDSSNYDDLNRAFAFDLSQRTRSHHP